MLIRSAPLPSVVLTDIQAVLFDCDGVLVDSEPLANQMLSELFAAHGVVMSIPECRAAFTGLNPRGVAIRLLELKGLDLTDVLVNHASAYFVEALAKQGLPPLPGVLDALASLKSRGIPFAAASNSELKELTFKLRLAGLINFFAPHHYSGDELRRPKPDPAVYLHAAEQLNVKPSDCVVIEDSPLGVRAGAAAGMRVLGFTGTHDDPSHADTLRRAGAAQTFADMSMIPTLIAR